MKVICVKEIDTERERERECNCERKSSNYLIQWKGDEERERLKVNWIALGALLEKEMNNWIDPIVKS